MNHDYNYVKHVCVCGVGGCMHVLELMREPDLLTFCKLNFRDLRLIRENREIMR